MSRRRDARAGFSLIEIALALGIVAFAMVAILGMFPMALDAAKDSRIQSRVAVMGQSIFSDLRSGPHAAAPIVVGQPASEAANIVEVDLNSTVPDVYVAFDDEGRAVSRMSLAQYQAGISTADFVARLKSIPDHNRPNAADNLPGLALVSLRIESPAAAPASQRKSYRLVTQIGDNR